MIFVNSMSDLFHEQVPFEFIEQVFDTMANAPQHTYQVLTKRPERMLEFVTGYDNGQLPNWLEAMDNIWLGVSVEDQRTANERIPLLLQTPAAVRWVSAEPLLGEVRLDRLRTDGEGWAVTDALTGERRGHHENPDRSEWMDSRVDWVVVGGESGPNARPMDMAWAQDLRRQCKAAGVPFFMKQLSQVTSRRFFRSLGVFPEDLQVREWPAIGQIPVVLVVPEPETPPPNLFEGRGARK